MVTSWLSLPINSESVCASIFVASTVHSRPSTLTRNRPSVRWTFTCRTRPLTSISYCTSAQPFGTRAIAPAAGDDWPIGARNTRGRNRSGRQHRLERSGNRRDFFDARVRLDERLAVASLENFVEVGRVKPAGEKVRLREQPGEKRDCRLDPG